MERPCRTVTNSFYKDLRSRDEERPDREDRTMRDLDEANLAHEFNDTNADEIHDAESLISVGNTTTRRGLKNSTPDGQRQQKMNRRPTSWAVDEEDLDDDVPASLLVENNAMEPRQHLNSLATTADGGVVETPGAATSPGAHRAHWDAARRQQRLYGDDAKIGMQPQSVMETARLGGRRERALWRWVNTASLDSFMRDVYDYFEGGGIWCILCSNALWLLYGVSAVLDTMYRCANET